MKGQDPFSSRFSSREVVGPKSGQEDGRELGEITLTMCWQGKQPVHVFVSRLTSYFAYCAFKLNEKREQEQVDDFF